MTEPTIPSARRHTGAAFILGLTLALAPGHPVLADSAPATNTASRFPCNPQQIAHYTAYRAGQAVRIDGRLDEKCWQAAPRSPRFRDILTGKPTLYDTRAAVLWDDQNLYVAFWVEEPHVKATLTRHGSHIYENNDVEVFIAGRDTYYEFEINALNTVYEAFFIWEDAYDKGGYAQAAEFNRTNPLVVPFNGVGFTNHPRGMRLGSWAFEFPGLKTAVHVDGTLNDDSDTDRGWTVELAFPWQGMKWLAKADGRALPPRDGDVWRIDFSRFNQYKAPPPAEDSSGWFWSPHGVWDSHIPECFPYIRFSTNDVRRVTGQSKTAE
ncbi:MAG TPA: carbohydrate-binding family 9-like protein [Candidatus Acidoferrum sp.]|nr:carbohydrate-binding family 9-like protein [Candidatus Acidoferrum sp.]